MLKRSFFTVLLSLFLISPALQAAHSSDINFPELMLQADEAVKQGKWDESQDLYLKAGESHVAEQRVKAYEGLVRLYKTLRMPKKMEKAQKRVEDEKKFIASLVPPEDSYYKTITVLPGDTYAKIALREKISEQWLKRANNRKLLVEGKTAKVPILPYNLVVNRLKKTLEWKRGEEVIKVYPVAVGKKETETPAGEFSITSKVKNPVWYHLNLQIPPESPKNLLGPRWLGLNVKGYGIHGTRNPNSINYAVSHGCVRMYNRDVKELFEWIDVGTKVTIGDMD